jgi:hypothetical protein
VLLLLLLLQLQVVTVELRDKMAALLPQVRLENLYSISECHDISYANLNTLNTRESPKYAPCGTVIPNVTALILDEQMRQVSSVSHNLMCLNAFTSTVYL